MPSTFSFLKSSVQNRRASNHSTDSSRSASASAITAPSASTTASSSISSSAAGHLASSDIAASDKTVVAQESANRPPARSQRKFPTISTASSEIDPRDSIPSIDITSPSSDQPKNLWTPGEEATSFNFGPSTSTKTETQASRDPARQSISSSSSDEDHLFSLNSSRNMPRPLSITSKKNEAAPKKGGKAEVPDRHDVMRRAMADATNSDAFGGISNDTTTDSSSQAGVKVPASNSNGSVLDNGSVGHGDGPPAGADKIGEGSLTFDHFTPSPGEGEMVHADGTSAQASNALEGKPGQTRKGSIVPSENGQDAYFTESPTQSIHLGSTPKSAALPSERSHSMSGPASGTGHGRYATTGHDSDGNNSRQSSLFVPGSAGSNDGKKGASKHMHESASTSNIPTPLQRLRKLSDSGSSHGKIKPAGGIAGALAASGMAGMGVGHAGSLQSQGSLTPTKEKSRSRNSSVAADYIASYREAGNDYKRDRSTTGSTLSLASSDMSAASGLNAAAHFSGAQSGLNGADNSMRRTSDAPLLTPGGIGAVGGLSPSGAGERVALGDDEAWPGDMGSQITGFAVASSKRNADFHSLFTSVPEDDYLIEDYGCALVREILIQGRLYVSENHVCFYANIFGWVTNIVLPFSEIVSIEKRMTAYVIPNAIQIATLHSKQTFASFLSRDTTYDLIVNIWKLSHPGVPTEHAAEMMTDEESVDHDTARDVDHDGDKGVEEATQGKKSKKNLLKRKLGIKDNDNSATSNGSGGDTAAQNGSSIGRSKSPAAQGNKKGPHRKTECPCDKASDKDKKHYSTIALDTTYPAVPEKLYNLMFTSGFMKDFWTDNQKLLELHLSDWAPNPEADDLLSRSITYIKPLTGSFGPKQTKCHLTEQNLHVEFDEYVIALTTTRTPDVPSGGSFSVKTKTCLTWAGGNVTKVHVTCQVDWTGRSMVKGIIDRASIDGQKEYYKDLDVAIRKYMKDHSSEFREEGDDEGAANIIESQAESGVDSAESKDKEADGSASSSDSTAKEGMAKYLDMASEGASTVFDFVSDVAGGASPSVLILGAVVFLLVVSNLWAFKSPSSRDPLDPHTLRESSSRGSSRSIHHERETAQHVAIAVREVLQDYFDPSRESVIAAGRVSGQNQTPRLSYDDPIEEMQSLLALLDDVEGRVAKLRDHLKSASAGQSSASAKDPSKKRKK